MKSVVKMGEGVKQIYIMALRKHKPVNFRVHATAQAIAIFVESLPAWATQNDSEANKMILEYVRFDNETID